MSSHTTWFAPASRVDGREVAREALELENLGNMKAMLDAMPDIVMIINEQRQILFGNRALASFCAGRGLSLKLGARPGELLQCVHAADMASGCGTSEACRTCGAVRAMLEGLSGQTAVHECRIATGSGDALDLRIWASPLLWEGRECAVVIATDISNAKRREMLERIFFHDLLNTVGSIVGISDLLQHDASMIGELKDDLHTAAAALLGEIRSQRLLLEAENNRLLVNPVPLRSLEVLESVAAPLRSHEVAEGRFLKIAPDAEDFEVVLDRDLLSRVIGNMLKNALEASLPGEVVMLGCRASGADRIFWCHNREGIPRDVQLQIFQRSFSTKGPGRGLGTYSLKLLAERYLGGSVSFTSTDEQGTTFRVSFPEAPTKPEAGLNSTLQGEG